MEDTLNSANPKNSMPRKILLSAIAITGIGLTGILMGCDGQATKGPNTAAQMVQESARINDWFEARYEDELARSPISQTYLGLKSDYGKLDDSSQIALDEDAALTQSWLQEMRSSFDYDRLDPQSKLSYRLYEYAANDSLALHGFSDHAYVFQHMSAPHTSFPSFMINLHAVDSESDAENYIARLSAAPEYMRGFMNRADAQFDKDIRLPAFVYPKLSEAARNVITGAPFSEGADSPLYADIKSKIDALDVDAGRKADLEERAKAALLSKVQPAYLSLIEMFTRHAEGASDDDGAWKLPRGEAYYQARLKHYTTTDLGADEIHEIGLAEVERIQAEMRQIMKTVGYEGTLQEFFTYLRTDAQFTFPNTEAGRTSYIEQATDVIDEMKAQSESLFNTQPQAGMVVKRVEPFREETAFGAFYERPSLDGSRPGTYYINLRDMKELPNYQLQALAYHEGVPGHHMQIAIAQELQGLPKFRTQGGHTAYVEGWALYAESVPAELGLYTDPYQDFGRLSMEIFRAVRLVVDTGIHAKKWTRQEAVDYFLENSANSEADIRAEIDRYIVWPGQATAYKMGMLKITELKNKAETELGDNFDIREFHDVILANGSVPLSILEELVNEWIADALKKGTK